MKRTILVILLILSLLFPLACTDNGIYITSTGILSIVDIDKGTNLIPYYDAFNKTTSFQIVEYTDITYVYNSDDEEYHIMWTERNGRYPIPGLLYLPDFSNPEYGKSKVSILIRSANSKYTIHKINRLKQ